MFSFEEDDQELETANRYAVVIQEVPHVAKIIEKKCSRFTNQILLSKRIRYFALERFFRFCLSDEQVIDMCIKTPDLDENLLIFRKNITDVVDIAVTLPDILHERRFVSILHLLKKNPKVNSKSQR